MPDSRDSPSVGGSAIMASAVAGAVVGAAGLALWLLSAVERRRRQERQQGFLQAGREQTLELQEGEALQPERLASVDPRLHDRVQKLNQAIEEVRRQLERMQPQN